MYRLVTASRMKELDRRAIEEWGIPGAVLMENAGRSVADAIEQAVEGLAGAGVVVVCGRGNNGGDGFVVTRHLLNRGADVSAFLLGRVEELKGDARLNADLLVRAHVPITELTEPATLTEALAGCDVVVDAIFGTGLASAPQGLAAEAIRCVNQCDCLVVSVDMPSGVCSDTGEVFDPAVTADLTVTMALPKLGLSLFPGRERAGDIEVADIGIPDDMLDGDADTFLTADDHVLSVLPPRPPTGHKGTFGTALLVCGARGYSGAACLSGIAATRSGCGLVHLAVPCCIGTVIEANVVEAVKHHLPDTNSGTVSKTALDLVLRLAGDAGCVAVGPGITTDPETAAFLLELLPGLTGPVVLDADGINGLAGRAELLRTLKAPIILTPHPGELSRLTGRTSDDINRTRVETAREFATGNGLVLVLKGAPTVVASPGGEVFVNPTGNSGLGTGGTGDVLTGLIAGLVAQGMRPFDGAVAAVFIHGRAADIIVQNTPERGITAGDVAEAIPDAFASLLEPEPD